MLEIDNLKIMVSRGDTFDIPFVISNHVMLDDEKFIFTVRKQLPTRSKFIDGVQGEILFQKEIFKKDCVDVKTEAGEIVGFSFYVSANENEAKDIPVGKHYYDLALINENAKRKIAIITPRDFYNVEVLRNV